MALNIVSNEIKQELLKLKKEDLTISFITKNFGYTTKRNGNEFVTIPPRYKQNMKMHLKAGEFINKKDIETTVGIFLFNKLMIENRLEDIIPDGYVNKVVTKKVFDKILGAMSNAVMSGKIKIIPTVSEFLRDYEFYGLKLVSVFSPSYSMNLLAPNPEVMKEKEKLLKETELRNVQDMAQLEDKLVDKAAQLTANDPAKTLFDSGSRGSFGNDYKNMSITVGPVENPVTNKFDFVKSNYLDGLQKEDLVAAGNVVVTSEYPKAVGTQVGGYLTKQFYAVYQSIVIDDEGTDCGTNQCLEIFLTPEIAKLFLYQNIRLPSGKLVVLTNDNVNEYLNTTVKFRSPMFCLNDKICSKCAGDRYSNMGIKNIGLTAGKVSNNLMNKRMKKRHQMKVTLDNVDVDKLLI